MIPAALLLEPLETLRAQVERFTRDTPITVDRLPRVCDVVAPETPPTSQRRPRRQRKTEV